MEREIIFKGKRIDNGEWIFAELKPEESGTFKGVEFDYTVDGNSLGQFIGLLDRNGNKIFEGDILQKYEVDYNSDEYAEFERNGYNGEEPIVATKKDVCSLDRYRYWLAKESFGWEGEDLEEPENWEIIGNIHDIKK